MANLAYFSGMTRYCIFVIFICSFCTGSVRGQSEAVCDAIGVIVRDAPNKFRNIRGKLMDANSSATLWECGVSIPGTLKSRFVASMGLFYEGAFLQTQKIEEVGPVYEKYKSELNTCLSAMGYKMSLQDNFYPGLQQLKKLVFMQEISEGVTPALPPAHIALEATYSKDLGIYTVVLYIFDH